MKDRVATYPGRVKLTPVSGQENVYDLERWDSPTETGTPLNKANLLTDAVAADLLGLSTYSGDMSVSEAIQQSIYRLHSCYWWAKYTKDYVEKKAVASSSGFVSDTTYSNKPYVCFGSSYSGTTRTVVRYSSTISINSSTGAVSLGSYTSLTMSSISNVQTLRGKYFKITTIGTYMNTSFTTSDIYYFAPEGGTFDSSSGSANRMYICPDHFCVVSGDPVGNTFSEFVYSASDSTYPKNNVSGDYYYQFIGIPMAEVIPRLESGTYTGTGTNGADNPNFIRFSFAPKLFFLYGYSDSSHAGITTLYYKSGSTFANTYITDNLPLNMEELTTDFVQYSAPTTNSNTYANGYAKKSADGKTLFWYHTGSADNYSQNNALGTRYFWYAIG